MSFFRGRRTAIAIGGILCAIAAAAAPVAAQVGPQVPKPQGSAENFLGKWDGTLGAGAVQLHLHLELYDLPNGATAGNLAVAEQGTSLDINTISVDGNSVRLEIHRVGGVYQGTLSADANEIQGTWTQTAAPTPQPLNFRRAGTKAPETAKPAQEAPTPKQFTAPLDLSASVSPTAFAADGRLHLAYELHIANYGRYDCAITKLEVLGDESGDKAIGEYSGANFEGVLSRPGLPAGGMKAKIAPGGTAIAYLWVTLAGNATAPAALRHRVTMLIGNNPEPMTIVTAPLSVNRRGALLISPPLAGDGWLAANGPSNTSQHRRALIPVNGRAYIAQRFAIDWVRLNADGKTYQGDPLDNKNYRAYGSEALAVADGTVTETKDGIPENTPGPDSRAAPMTLENIAGNHVLLNLGGGIYAMYAHLQPGSLKVHEGEKVKRGQVLGLVGNTGNSTEPHLHFDLCDANATLGCEGLPYALPSFTVIGSGWGWKVSESHEAPVLHQREIPLENQVVAFPEAQEHHLLPHH